MTNLHRIIGYLAATLVELAMAGAFGAVSQDVNGWTVVTPSSDSRIAYVSSTDGNDANDGLDPHGFNLSTATYTHSSRTITSTGAFASYTFAGDDSDKIYIDAATGGVTSGKLYTIESKTSDNAIVLAADAGLTADATGVGSSDGPKATIASGNLALRDNYPDHLLLKRGDTFTTTAEQNTRIGRSLTEPHLISGYGTGNRPKIINVDTQPFRLISRSYVFIIGIHFDGTTRTNEDVGGGAIVLSGKGVGYHFEDCLMDSMKGGFNLSGFNGVFEDVTIRRNIIVNSWSGTGHCQGAYIDTTHGLLLEENILDHNGWHETLGTGATIYNHNLYITHETRDVVIQNNIISRGASSGLKFQPNGGTHYVTNNLFVKNAIVGTVGGGQPSKVVEGQGAVIYWNNNVAVEPQDNGTGERGGLTSSNLEGGTYRNNIMAHASASTIQAYWTDGWESQGVGVDNFSMIGNVFYGWRSGIALTNNMSGMTFQNNIIHLPNQATDRYTALYRTGGTFTSNTGNQYYSGAAAGIQFEVDDVDANYATYIAATGETSSSNSEPTYTDATRNVSTYITSVLLLADYDAFVAALVAQGPSNWDADLQADAVNDWIRTGFDVTEYSQDPDVLDVLSATVDAAGTSLTVVFDQAATNYTGFTLTPSGGAATLTYSSGDGTSTIVYTISRTIAYDETLTLAYSQSTGNIVNGSATELADFSGFAVTNSSEDGSGPDVTAPTFVSATLDLTGRYITVAYDETITATNATGWSVSFPRASVALSFSGIDSGSLVLETDRKIYNLESGTISYSSGSGSVEDLAENAAGDVTTQAVTNNSTQSPLGLLLQ